MEASPAGASDSSSTGTVTFIDNAVDQATDTIRLKATFPNNDRRLWPGAFVDVTLQLSVDQQAKVIPAKAVQPSQQGEFVFVVKGDQTVEARQVKVAWIDGDEAVIETGVTAGETVVTDGQLRLTPGRQNYRESRRQTAMNISAPFIRRPVATTLIQLAIVIFGILGYRSLPVSDLPNVDFPTLQVEASLPGANPETMAAAVATPLEKQFADDLGHHVDQLQQHGRQHVDHAAVRSRPGHRRGGAGRAGRDLAHVAVAAAGHAVAAVAPEGQPGGLADPLSRAELADAAAVARSTSTPRSTSPSGSRR